LLPYIKIGAKQKNRPHEFLSKKMIVILANFVLEIQYGLKF